MSSLKIHLNLLWKHYNEDADRDDFQYHEFLILLTERINIVKVEKQPSCMIKKEYVIRIRNLRQALLNHGLVLKKSL